MTIKIRSFIPMGFVSLDKYKKLKSAERTIYWFITGQRMERLKAIGSIESFRFIQSEHL